MATLCWTPDEDPEGDAGDAGEAGNEGAEASAIKESTEAGKSQDQLQSDDPAVSAPEKEADPAQGKSVAGSNAAE